MVNDSDAEPRTPSRRGRHRTPGAAPPWLATVRVGLAVCGVIAALWLVSTLVSTMLGGGAENPGAAAPSPAATQAASESPAAPPSSGPADSSAPSSATASTPAWSAQGAAESQLAAFGEQVEGAAKGALVLAGKFGDDVVNTPVVVTAAWGNGRMRNGLTVAENHEQALRAGKLTSRKSLPTATTTAKVAVTRSDVRSLPVASARDSFAALTDARGPDCAQCSDIIVTGVASTTTKVATTLGPVIVPAWSYEVLGTKARIVVPALAPTALLDPSPGYRGEVPAAIDAGQLPLWRASLGRDGRVFTAFVDTADVRKRGGCWRLFAVETADAVAVYAARGRGVATAPCASGTGRVSVRFAAPLGGRTVLDTYWSRAIAP